MTLKRTSLSLIILICILIIGVSSNDEVVRDRRSANRNICEVVTPIYNADGDFLKNICYVTSASRNYDDAANHCATNGMNLLIIENEDVMRGFLNHLNENHSPGDVWGETRGVWINGRKFGNRFYVYRKDIKYAFPSGITLNSSGGDCLVLKKNYAYEARAWPCSRVFWSYCEFDSVF